MQDALIRDLVERFTALGVGEVLDGNLGGVLATHWSAMENEKTHEFWIHGRFRRRLHKVLDGEYGISV